MATYEGNSKFLKGIYGANDFLQKLNSLGMSNASLISSGINLASSFIKEPPGYSGKYGTLLLGLDKTWDAASDAVMAIPGWGTVAGVAMKGLGLLNKGIQRLGGGTDGMTKTDAWLSSSFLGWTPLGMINGFGGKKADTYSRSKDLDTKSSAGFLGFQSLLDVTQQGAGKKYGLFSSGAREKQNKLTEYTQGIKHTISGIVDYNTLNNLAAQGTTPFAVQLQNIDLNGGILMLRAAAKGMKLKPIKQPKFKLKFYDPFKATLGEDWQEVYDPDGVRTAIPSVLTSEQQQGLAPIPTQRGGIVYMGANGKLSKTSLRALYAKNGVKFAKRIVKKCLEGALLEVVPSSRVGEDLALKYTAEAYPFIAPYLDNVRVYNATNNPQFNRYADLVKGDIEFIGNDEYYRQFPTSSGIPVYDENNNRVTYHNPYPDNITVVYRNLDGDRLNNAVAMDLVSHYGKIDPKYKELYDNALNLMMSDYSELLMSAASSLGQELRTDNKYKDLIASKDDIGLADWIIDQGLKEYPDIKDRLYSHYEQKLDGIIRDLISLDRLTYHNTPYEALEDYAEKPEQKIALRKLMDYVNNINREDYFMITGFKNGGKTEYRGVKEASTGQTIGIPGNITDALKNGREPIKTNSGRQVIMRRDGTVIYVEAARLMRPFLKKGGKMNVIPEGALHARKNHLTDIDTLYKEVTHKGIPVITVENGEVIQHAEVELSEIIFTKEVTDQIELYRELGTDEAALACGKLLVKEILYNTDDRAGLIQTIE